MEFHCMGQGDFFFFFHDYNSLHILLSKMLQTEYEETNIHCGYHILQNNKKSPFSFNSSLKSWCLIFHTFYLL